MNVLIIGLGSMGKRRIRLLRELYPAYQLFGVDSRHDRIAEAEELFQITCYKSLMSVKEECECAFVCTSPLSHSEIISECLKRGLHVFSELNLVDDGYTDNMKRAKEARCVLFLSSTFLYREETKYICSKITNKQKWNYIYHVGQYLPDWHPWENYQDFFVGDIRTNGCREILAIELPWLTAAFGKITEAKAVSDRLSKLQVDGPDNCLIQISHENGNKGCLIVDVVSPCAVRRFETYTEGHYISWEGIPDSLMEYNPEENKLQFVTMNEDAEHVDGYQKYVIENAYKNEIRHFFEEVSGKRKPVYGFEEDQIILKIIDSLGV